jgi:glyoxylate reductase
MNKKIFVTRMIPAIGIDMLKEKGYEIDINPKDKILDKKELIKILKKGNYDAVLSLLTDKIDSQVFDSAKTVKLFANYATGFDNIDIVEAKKRGILVSNAPTEFSSSSVAEHTISLAFALLRRIVESVQHPNAFLPLG